MAETVLRIVHHVPPAVLDAVTDVWTTLGNAWGMKPAEIAQRIDGYATAVRRCDPDAIHEAADDALAQLERHTIAPAKFLTLVLRVERRHRDERAGKTPNDDAPPYCALCGTRLLDGADAAPTVRLTIKHAPNCSVIAERAE